MKELKQVLDTVDAKLDEIIYAVDRTKGFLGDDMAYRRRELLEVLEKVFGDFI
jgi:septum formation topological specificity factor MinE